MLLLSLLTFMALNATSCGSDKPDNPLQDTTSKDVTVTVSQEAISVSSEAGVAEFTVNASVDWSIKTDASWISLRPSGGIKNQETTVKAIYEANKDFDDRSALIEITSGGKVIKTIAVNQNCIMQASLSTGSLTFGGQGSVSKITVTANGPWTLSPNMDWITVTPSEGNKGETTVEIKVAPNDSESSRDGIVVLNCGDVNVELKIVQLSDVIEVPEGYTLVWNDEFNEGPKLSSDWVGENQKAGWVNNELQTYTTSEKDGKSTLEVKDGFLHINCFKSSDGKIYSGRINAKPNTGWLYGYFEARINLPKGKGTWPAFWMMPSNVDWSTNGWPKCGEIDIMEEVGVDANQVSSSIHTEKYNHTKNTQKTHAMNLPGAEGEFHIYALEWTEDEITTYVDGKVQLHVTKTQLGSDHDSWPFHYAFYPILNLAWGGDWGGYAGVDDGALPVTMLVDYVRIFQKQ